LKNAKIMEIEKERDAVSQVAIIRLRHENETMRKLKHNIYNRLIARTEGVLIFMSATKSKRPILAVIVIIIIIAAGVGVYFATQSSSAPVSSTTSISPSTSVSLPTTLTVDERAVPGSMDPGVVIDNDGLEVAQNTNLPLVFCGYNDTSCSFNRLVPVLATSWTGSSDGMTYTFILRNGVYYNNGDPFNAYVVWWNVYRDMIINQASDFVFYLYFNTTGVTPADVNSLNNAQNMPNSTLLQIMENPHNSATVLNASAVQFHLTNPFVPFMASIETAPWVFVDPYVVEQHGGVALNAPNSYMSFNGTTVGDGPYITQVYLPSEYTVLISNPNYWAQNLTSSETNYILEPAKIPRVTIYYKTDELARALDLENKQVQAAPISFDDIKKVLQACTSCTIPNIGLSGTVEFVMIDSLKPPLNNLLLRRAIIAAINVSQIQQTVYNGYAVPFVGPEPSGLPLYPSSVPTPVYDLTLAKQDLAAAGYPNGVGLPAIDFYYFTSTYHSLEAQIMKADLAQIGITLNLHEISAATLFSFEPIPGQNATAMDMATDDWTYYADFSAYEFLIDQRFGAFGNMRNDTIYNLILKSNTEINPTARAQDIAQIAGDTQQQASEIWMGQDVNTYDTGAGMGPTFFNNCVAGLWYNTDFNGIDFNSVYYACAP
jgi:ABC-type transport system substrate-binding protein